MIPWKLHWLMCECCCTVLAMGSAACCESSSATSFWPEVLVCNPVLAENGSNFRTFLVDFWAQGSFLQLCSVCWAQGSKKVKSLTPFWSHFWKFWGLGGSPFFDVFLVPLLDGIFVNFGAKVAPQRGFWGVILETIWRP